MGQGTGNGTGNGNRTCQYCQRVPLCEPGHEPTRIGKVNFKFECKPCETGTYSSSRNGWCRNWTDCESSGFITLQEGNSTHNSVCGFPMRPLEPARIPLEFPSSTILAILTAVAVFVLILLTFLLHFCIWTLRKDKKNPPGDLGHSFPRLPPPPQLPLQGEESYSIQFPEEEHGEKTAEEKLSILSLKVYMQLPPPTKNSGKSRWKLELGCGPASPGLAVNSLAPSPGVTAPFQNIPRAFPAAAQWLGSAPVLPEPILASPSPSLDYLIPQERQWEDGAVATQNASKQNSTLEESFPNSWTRGEAQLWISRCFSHPKTFCAPSAFLSSGENGIFQRDLTNLALDTSRLWEETPFYFSHLEKKNISTPLPLGKPDLGNGYIWISQIPLNSDLIGNFTAFPTLNSHPAASQFWNFPKSSCQQHWWEIWEDWELFQP
ncbi:tumor necrosis factor receptor superfamily member 18 isoform X2 [Corvus hawaiiensis]|uniref:tumor necrosis factor receptor superfamily member 18 isoform X2 n=1 Tax=Corvus hawaiiensis TaxID=134902 RepID=UPI002019D4B2|nr:tumor necrosis factor receptor superfamily member 18 isoform X2 [Corvus hawaiiensis]